MKTREYLRVMDFIADASIEDAENIVNEVLMFHSMLTWNHDTKSLDSIESITINSDCIQINIEKEGNK